MLIEIRTKMEVNKNRHGVHRLGKDPDLRGREARRPAWEGIPVRDYRMLYLFDVREIGVPDMVSLL